MNIFRIAAELFLLYILYKLIFDFIIPVYQSTQRMRNHIGEMQNKMHQDLKATKARHEADQQRPKVKREGDYIDFEEIK